MENYIFASNKNWNKVYFESLQKNSDQNWLYVSNPSELKISLVKKPRYIFFLHWSWKVEKNIYQNYECVCFHMTDLPFGRGGTPLQNLILLGFKKTKLTAFKMQSGMDEGPIYAKRDLSLSGRAQNIYLRAGKVSTNIINWIIKNNPIPKSQIGKATLFKRRTLSQSEIPKKLTMRELFDFIRMLDAETYPKANIKYGNFEISFFNVKQGKDEIYAQVIIKNIEN